MVTIKRTATTNHVITQVGLNFLPYDEAFRRIRKEAKWQKCFRCGHKWDDGEMLALAICNTGNKVLCSSCGEEILEQLQAAEREGNDA